MCGFAGFFSSKVKGDSQQLLERMGDRIAHRGPDDKGVWLDSMAGIGLSHRRLSILDLSSAGHQPMISPSGRFVIAFNGEIYNHLDIRRELQIDAPWRGHSDTETLLMGFESWGIETTVKKTIGMFAFSVWDKETQELTLGRDRLGEKPLYYGWQGGTFLFGSDLSALKVHPDFRAEIDRQSLSLLLQFSYIPSPNSIFQGIRKLLPGSLLTISHVKRDSKPSTYWDAMDVVHKGLDRPFIGSPEEAVSELNTLLRDSVSKQMISDVPLGAFLSGGVDSSLVVALMQSQSTRTVKTFTIGFDDESYNEAVYAKAVARHLGTDHTEVFVSPKQALDVVPRLPSLYSEPFSDSSQIPTFLVSQMAKRDVSVSLSGDAGDELFGGYNRYILAQKFWREWSRLPVRLRKGLSRMMTTVPPEKLNKVFGPLQRLLPFSIEQSNLGEKIHKAAEVLPLSSLADVYGLLVRHWQHPQEVVLGSVDVPHPQNNHQIQNPILGMMANDLISYLPGDILTKVDRAAMGVSLETRLPLLDHRVVDFAWTLPFDYKVRHGVGKWVLRQVLYKYVPRKLVERPKMGFGIPLGSWLRGPLKDWAEDLLGESRLTQEGYFNPTHIRQKWKEHLSGQRNWQYQIWDVLMFQAWLKS